MNLLSVLLIFLAWHHCFEGRYVTFLVCLIAGCAGTA